MKNRKLLLIVSLVLALTMSLGGTMAYLQDTDSDVNTMTLGSVTIEQHEYQRVDADKDGDYDTTTIKEGETEYTSYVLEGFQQDKPLLPTTELKADGTPDNHGAGGRDSTTVRMSQVGSYGGVNVFKAENAVDKFVTVENTGVSDAYVRTYVAFEKGTSTGKTADDDDLIGVDFHTNWSVANIGDVTINGNTYEVLEFVYKGASDNSRHVNGVLPGGDTTYPNLTQVYLNAMATNEDLEALDGNKNGTYDILVLSQAVQADGFKDAAAALTAGFGEATAANVKGWFETDGDMNPDRAPAEFVVKTAAEAQAALDAAMPGDTIRFAEGNYGVIYFRQSDASEIVRDRDYASSAYEEVKIRTFEDLTIVADEGAVIDGFKTEAQTYMNTAHSNSEVYPILDSFIELKNVKFDGLKFSGEANALDFDGKVSVEGMTVTNCKMERARNVEPDYAFIVQKGNGAAAEYTVNGETFKVQFANVTVDNCVASYVDRFILAFDTKNLTVTNNKAANVSQHFINLQAGKLDHTGKITITGNTYVNGADRFFRAAYLADAKLVVERNTVNNAFYGVEQPADELDLVKVNVREGSAFTYTNYENKVNTTVNAGATFVPTVVK